MPLPAPRATLAHVTEPEPDATLRRYALAFDAGRYWDAHEVLEVRWQHDRRPVWQALIQLAAAMVHVEAGRRAGALRVATRALARLQAAADDAEGIDVAAIRAAASALVRRLADASIPVAPRDVHVEMTPLLIRRP